MQPKLNPIQSQSSNSSSDSNGIKTCKVTSIVLDDTHKLFNDLGGWNSIGTITFTFLESNAENVNIQDTNLKDNIAIPLNPNVKSYPLLNELVYTIELPSIPSNGATGNSTWYYFTTINLLNSPHQNSYILTNNSVKFNLAGIPFRNSKTNNSSINLGSNFTDNPSIKPLLAFEGDYIIEGRNGNSIRFGGAATKFKTQWESKTQSNYFIISGRTDSKIENVHVIEDLNTDDYISAGFANHKLNISLPSSNFASYNLNIQNAASAPETLYEVNSTTDNTNSSTTSNTSITPNSSQNIIENTEIYNSPETNTDQEFYNEPSSEFETPDYVYVLDDITVNERTNVYAENPDHVVYNTNIVPVNYLTLSQFGKICNSNVVAARYLKSLNQTLTLYKINNNKRIAHFLSQCLIESANFTRLEEIGSVDYFSKYEKPGNRLGNVGSGSGYKYRGRGIIQITGKYNYDKLFKDLNVIGNNPDLISKSPLNVLSAGWYWNMRSLNSFADADNFGSIRTRVQGTPQNRISDIKQTYNKIIKILSDGTT